ncbi:thioredoxin family protein [Mesorhizobium marinum]|uniref:thioredoxin family protein n=1 Tax=Mesorhizobium marinum TaxID=3228790 RepID=UPI003467E601
MIRRTFILGLAASAALPAMPALAAGGFVDYRPGVIEKALAAGKTVFVDYAATWCTTCKAQSRVLAQLMKENPAYAQSMTFVRVDWDDYGDQPVARDRNIPRRSTLLVLRGDRELGRIVAGTSKAEIKALLDKGL